ncbi:MAG: phospholipase D-like domain-containing protein [Rhodanobacteraceae bacterium]
MIWLIVALVCVGTALAVVIGLNFVAPEKRVQHKIAHTYDAADPQFRREMDALLGPAVLGGNRIEDLQNGERIFPPMLEAIASARSSITFETFIYWSGAIGRKFADALTERARAGVRVHVLLDWVGSDKMKKKLLQQMADAGVAVQRYHPLNLRNLSRMDNRTHRKLLVVDGTLGFTGGVGIADNWEGDAQDPDHWRDSHFRIEGPVVAQVQSVFMDNWIKTTGEVLQGEKYFPALHSVGDMQAQMFSSSPRGGSESMQLMYLVAITAAVKSIDLAESYFVPDALTRKTLVQAAGRGVRIRVITPGDHIDTQTVRQASRTCWEELLKAGIEIHEFEPTMNHCKIMLIDGLLASVGSTNFDNRSFALNDEANLNVYDRGFVERLTQVFERDLQRCKRITLQAWQRRPWHERARERVSSLFSPQL